MAIEYNYIKNGKKYYRKTLVIGHKKNGSSIRKEFYGNGKKNVEKQIEEYKQKLTTGLNIKVENLTVQEGMYIWLFKVLLYAKNNKSASFAKHECNYRNYIKDTKIGQIKIQNAVSLPFEEFYTEIYKNGIDIIDIKTKKKYHKKVNENKIFDLNKTLRAFFHWCIKQKYTNDNPCSLENIELPGNADGDEDETEEDRIQAFSDMEVQIITNLLKYNDKEDNTFNIAIELDFLTGLRLGELLGLKNKYINKYIIKVRNTLKKVRVYDTDKSWHLETKLIKPKSKTSVRNVPFPIPFWDSLNKYLNEQEKKWKEQGLKFDDDSLVFTTKTCKPIDANNFARTWKRFLKRNNIDYKRLHSIRDTYATMLIKRGALLHDIKELLGHSSTKITEKYYIYVFPEDKSKTVSLLDNLIK